MSAAFTASFVFVLLAELGDKTQFLAMALGARYGLLRVIAGTLLATALLNAIAVLAGRALATVIPLNVVSATASLAFIAFGIWMLREDPGKKEKAEEEKAARLGPVLTVATAFFLAELGDKTQLATVSLAAKYPSAVGVFLGATLGMTAADIAGIFAGLVLHKTIPEKKMRLGVALIFIAFGVYGIVRILTGKS